MSLLNSFLAMLFIVCFIVMCVAYTEYAVPDKDGKERHIVRNTLWGIGLLLFFLFGILALT